MQNEDNNFINTFGRCINNLSSTVDSLASKLSNLFVIKVFRGVLYIPSFVDNNRNLQSTICKRVKSSEILTKKEELKKLNTLVFEYCNI